MLARTRVGFGGSPERIFVFVTPPIQRRWYDVQSIRHGERRSFIIIDATGAVGTYTVAADCTGTISITDGPSFNIYVGPGHHFRPRMQTRFSPSRLAMSTVGPARMYL